MINTKLEKKVDEWLSKTDNHISDDGTRFLSEREYARKAYFAGYKQGEHDNNFCAGCLHPKKEFGKDINVLAKWHYCKEELPEDENAVLTFLNYQGCNPFEIGSFRDGEWYNEDTEGVTPFDDVIAWQPLPNPPENL